MSKLLDSLKNKLRPVFCSHDQKGGIVRTGQLWASHQMATSFWKENCKIQMCEKCGRFVTWSFQSAGWTFCHLSSDKEINAKTPFDHINAIYNNQSVDYFDTLSDVDKKTFNVYLINMGISMNPDFLPFVNEVNKHWDEMGPREVYLFYSQCLPKGKYYNKWVKGKKQEEYDVWLVELVSRHFEVSQTEANEYLSTFYTTDDGRDELKTILEGYGLDKKKLKKAKLV